MDADLDINIIRAFNESKIVNIYGLDKYLINNSAKSELDSVVSELSERKIELASLESTKGDLLPMEFSWYNNRHKKLTDTITSLEKKKSEKPALLIYPEINPGFLGMSKTNEFHTREEEDILATLKLNMPCFALFRYDSSGLSKIVVDSEVQRGTVVGRSSGHDVVAKGYSARVRLIDEHPKILAGHKYETDFSNFSSESRSMWGASMELNLKSEFSGFIPDEARKSITNAMTYFGKNIYVITEARWVLESMEYLCLTRLYNIDDEAKPKLKSMNSIEYVDSLIIGIHQNKTYFIDAFNCAPKGNHVKDTYVKGRLGLN